MDDFEDIFEDLDEEVVSTEPAPSKPTNNTLVSEDFKNNVADNLSNKVTEKMNPEMAKKMASKEISNKTANTASNSAKNMVNKNMNPATPQKLADIKGGVASSAGKELGNKIAGRSEAEKGNAEKAFDDVAGKAAGAAITAASGGAVSGPIADALGNAAVQVAKKEVKRKAKIIKYIIFSSLIFWIILISLFIVLFTTDDDISKMDSSEINSYLNDGISDENFVSFLNYHGFCNSFNIKTMDPVELIKEVSVSDIQVENLFKTLQTFTNVTDLSKNFDGLVRNSTSLSDDFMECLGITSYFKKIKENYQKAKETCASDIKSTYKRDTFPCELAINSNLLAETMSYDLTDRELYRISFENTLSKMVEDINSLTYAQSEFVHEKCYVITTKQVCTDVKKPIPGAPSNVPYYTSKSCSTKEIKENRDLYYFQVSFDKYTSFLKYGETSSHPNYSDKPLVLGNYDRSCTGATNDTISNSSSDSGSQVTGTINGNAIIEYAKQFVGNPYVWGGTSLTNGADCSGFTMQIFAKFGITLPHSSAAQASVGVEVPNIQSALPGDLITYYGHVAIYMGNNQIIHAGSEKTGINIKTGADYRPIKSIRRLVN